jgi:hypothetical protein
MKKELKMRVFIACEYSGVVRRAYEEKGHEAYSCDILESDDNSRRHIRDDVCRVLGSSAFSGKIDLLIAHPPCTYLCNSGVCHLHADKDRWSKMIGGANFFKYFLNFDAPFICVENPIMHKYAVEIIGRRQDQIIQPYMFGHLEQKATCLWLKNLPRLMPERDVKTEMMLLPKRERLRLHYLSPSPARAKIRSKTFSGIAAAMANQWEQR